MHGFIGNTDFDWFTFLRDGPPRDEVNFWKPSGRGFAALTPGEPFFFRLKSPRNAIAGFGLFARAEVMPDWLAWECFDTGNGAPDLVTMERRIAFYRERNEIGVEPVPHVGCVIVSAPLFFPDDLWVREPANWPKNVVTGKGYDLAAGEGQRVWLECQTRAAALAVRTKDSRISEVVAEIRDAYGKGIVVRPRLGQGTFRLAVEDAYEKSCAVTGEHSRPALEAAHIRPYTMEQRHEVTNGVLLRSDLHKLFDAGYASITPDGKFRVSERLRTDFANGKSYFPFDDRPIRLPSDERSRPARDKLAWHFESRFLR